MPKTGSLRFTWAIVLSMVAIGDSSTRAEDGKKHTVRPVLYDVVGGVSSSRITVRLTPDAVQRVNSARGVRHGTGSLPATSVLGVGVQQTLSRWNTTRLRPSYPLPFAHPELAAKYELNRYFVAEVPPGTNTVQMVSEVKRLGGDIESASVSTFGEVAQFIPDDPNFQLQYALHNVGQTYHPSDFPGAFDADIDAPEAWDFHTGRIGTVTVAIIDSGVGPHPELDGRLLAGADTTASTHCVGGPFDGTVCFNDTDCLGHPCEFPTDTVDLTGHGTKVAGIVAAKGNNAVGIAGVTWGANVLPIRVVDDGGAGLVAYAINALIWAVDQGAEICNMSLDYRFPIPTPQEISQFQSAVNYANDNGVLVVAAAGNRGNGEPVGVPGRLTHVFTVGATDARDELAFFSSTGPEVDVSAPGELVYSALPPDKYDYDSGTSFACPHVAGLAALIKSYAYYLTQDDIKNVIITTVDDLGAPGWDESFGYGRINAGAALASVTPSIAIVSSDPPDSAIDARQPSEPNGTNPAGWQEVKLFFDGDAAGLTPADFSVSVDPPGASPGVTGISVDGTMVTVTLDSTIPVGAWTIITHNDSNTSTRLGYLPSDVNNDRLSNTGDILALIDALNGVGGALPLWQTDINRSGINSPQDILRVIDLLNGADTYPPFITTSLPD